MMQPSDPSTIFHNRYEGFCHNIRFDIPYIITAIHAGSRMRRELEAYLVISDSEIHFEEDTATDLMIQGNPNTIWGLDSRAQYDLNRTRERSVATKPEYFWGKQVYSESLPTKLVQESLKRYDQFYAFIDHCITTLIDRFGFCVIYDIHSYNISRQKTKGITSPPMFNLGTKSQNQQKWRPFIDAWLECLREIRISQFETTVSENKVFMGQEGLSSYVANHYENVLVLPTEISKFYMDEKKGTVYENPLQELQQQLSVAVRKHQVQAETLLT